MGEGLKRARKAVRTNNAAVKAAKKLARERAAEEACALFFALLKRAGLPRPEREYVFHPEREWRMDFAYPIARVGIEVDGGIWIKGGGRHTRGSGWLKDTEKLNAAAALGYRMLRTTPDGLATLGFIETIARTLAPNDPL